MSDRIGLGFDVHAFAKDRKLILAGVTIPYEQGLLGHSDADVIAHALADAVLSAARIGDIGALFPDTDPRFKDADSLQLLRECMHQVRCAGFELVDADCVVMAQEPKISPYREQMRTNLACALQVDVSCVGLKATTTEHLGFTGRKEGIAASAVVLLNRISANC